MIYEWREYRTAPGKMPQLKERFRSTTLKFFEKHGIEVVGFWEAELGGDTASLYYLLQWPDLATREKVWGAFQQDPQWQEARAASEKDGPLLQGIHTMILKPTDFSPMK